MKINCYGKYTIKKTFQEIKRIRETDERKIDTLSYLLATLITNMN